MLENSDDYEVSDEDENDTGDNVEELMKMPDKLEMARNSEIETYFEQKMVFMSTKSFQWQSHPIPATRKRARNFVNSCVGLMDIRQILFKNIDNKIYLL